MEIVLANVPMMSCNVLDMTMKVLT